MDMVESSPNQKTPRIELELDDGYAFLKLKKKSFCGGFRQRLSNYH
jgi:hypothetical protein